MRKIGALVVALLVGCATGATVREMVAPARAQGQTGPSYEYEAVDVSNPHAEAVKAVAQQYGAQGWRLTAAMPRGSVQAILIFERQR